MRRVFEPALEQVIVMFQLGMTDPIGDGVARLFRNFKLNGLVGLLLHNHGSFDNLCSVGHIAHSEFDQITASEFAIDGQVKQRQVPESVGQLESNPDCPDLLELEGRLLTDKLAFVPWNASLWIVGEMMHVGSSIFRERTPTIYRSNRRLPTHCRLSYRAYL